MIFAIGITLIFAAILVLHAPPLIAGLITRWVVSRVAKNQ